MEKKKKNQNNPNSKRMKEIHEHDLLGSLKGSATWSPNRLQRRKFWQEAELNNASRPGQHVRAQCSAC